MQQCKALARIPAAFGRGSGQVICDLHMGHSTGLHFDEARQLWWLPALVAPEHPSPGLSDLEASLWRLLERRRVTVADAVPFMDELLAMFTAYAAGNGTDLTRERVEVLKRALKGNQE